MLHHAPDSAREYYRPELKGLHYATGVTASDRLTAWQQGRTGYPIVDAGMRQLLAEGWMHNRVRMIVASFLVKELHLEWTHGARHFLRHLIDGDLASNNHGWQWVAGTGTDAAPYYRVFNPVLQGQKFDPDGHYVRRYVPELAGVDHRYLHEPWRDPACRTATRSRSWTTRSSGRRAGRLPAAAAALIPATVGPRCPSRRTRTPPAPTAPTPRRS